METPFTAAVTRVATRLFACAVPLVLAGCAQPPQAVPDAKAVASPPTELITAQLIATEQERPEVAASHDLARLLVPRPPSYTLDSGDILSIVVWDHPELVGVTVKAASGAPELSSAGLPVSGFMVDAKGQLQFPFAGTFKIAGMTEQQASRVLEKRLARYIVAPKVALQVHAYRSKRVYVDGAVDAPGMQAINNVPMTLTEALSRAGGLLPTADQRRMVLERGKLRYRIDLGELVQKRINPSNVLLAAGDVVRVHAHGDDLVVVSGEVVAPRALSMRDGRLSLSEALGEAGGMSPQRSDARQVYVVRKTKDGVRLFQLDVRRADAMAMAQQFALHPQDIVHVAAAPPGNWNAHLAAPRQLAMRGAVAYTGKP